MPATRNILKHVTVETATKIRKCHANKSHKILPGQKHLAVYEDGKRDNICLLCAPKVLDVASNFLKNIVTELFANSRQ